MLALSLFNYQVLQKEMIEITISEWHLQIAWDLVWIPNAGMTRVLKKWGAHQTGIYSVMSITYVSTYRLVDWLISKAVNPNLSEQVQVQFVYMLYYTYDLKISGQIIFLLQLNCDWENLYHNVSRFYLISWCLQGIAKSHACLSTILISFFLIHRMVSTDHFIFGSKLFYFCNYIFEWSRFRSISASFLILFFSYVKFKNI